MAGRIRSIKPEINQDADVASLSSPAWRLWVSMWTIADDDGRLPASIPFLRSEVFWSREPERAIEELLAELVVREFIRLYRVRGQWFARLRNFAGKHQRIDKPTPPKHPQPEDADAEAELVEQENGSLVVVLREIDRRSSRAIRVSVASSPRVLAESSPSPPRLLGMGWDGMGVDGKGEDRAPPEASPTIPSEPFEPERAPVVKSPAKPPKPSPARGTRITPDWSPTPETIAWCAEQRVDAMAVVPEFVDHWTGVAGTKGVKIGWDGTFRNRVRKLLEYGTAPMLEQSQTRLKPVPPALPWFEGTGTPLAPEPTLDETLAAIERMGKVLP
jgi:hypothetical protein